MKNGWGVGVGQGTLRRKMVRVKGRSTGKGLGGDMWGVVKSRAGGTVQ